MDNKERPGVQMNIPPEEYFDYLYDDYKNQKRKVMYVFKDITIEKPRLKDFRHVFKCYLDDNGITEDDIKNENKVRTTYKWRDEAMWLFTIEKEDPTSVVYIAYKKNEFAGFVVIDPHDKHLNSVLGKEIYIRPKFRKSLVLPCIVDYIVNMEYKDQSIVLGGPNTDGWNSYSEPMAIGGAKMKLFTKNSGRRVHMILQKELDKDSNG